MQTGEHLAAPGITERVQVTREHLQMSVDWKGTILGIAEMKRHYSNYFKGIAHFKEYRTKLVTSFQLEEIMAILDQIEENAMNFELV